MKKRKGRLLWVLGITIYALLVFICLLFKNKDTFLADDNLFQWSPVIRQGFDQIFSGDGIPYWNFYQYKGYNIFSSGYYGFLNPFMYLSYSISRFLFSYQLETLIIYEWLLYWLGLLLMWILLEDFSLRRSTIVISLLVYSMPFIVFYHAFYYFTFNNWFFLPLLMFAMHRLRETHYRWVIPGILLAFSLLMGHIQYTCYYIMVYCILQVVFTVQKHHWKELLPFASNLLIFAGLSACFILVCMNIAQNRSEIHAGYRNFQNDPVYLKSVLNPFPVAVWTDIETRFEGEQLVGCGIMPYLALVPIFCWIIRTLSVYQEKLRSFQKQNRFVSTNLSAFGFFIGLRLILSTILSFNLITDCIVIGLLVVGTVIAILISLHGGNDFLLKKQTTLVCIILLTAALMMTCSLAAYLLAIGLYVYHQLRHRPQYSEMQKSLHAFNFAAFFFVIFGAGKDACLSVLLEQIPIFNQFRYLYKCAFLYIPILTVCGAAVLDKLPHLQKVAKTVSCFSYAVSFASVIFMVYSGQHPYINNKNYEYHNFRQQIAEITDNLNTLSIDRNYRFIIAYSYQDIFFKEFKNEEMKSKNPVVEKSSSIVSYAFTKNFGTFYGIFTLNGYDSVFTGKNFLQSNYLMKDMYIEGEMCNMSTTLLSYTNSDNTVLDAIQKQMIENSVKYVLVPEDRLDTLKNILSGCEALSIVRFVPWYRNLILVEIDGVNAICMDSQRHKIPLVTQMNQLNFTVQYPEPEEITISMTYCPNYIVKLTAFDGTQQNVKVNENDSGYVTFQVPAGNYTAVLTYRNRVMDKAVILAGCTLLLTILAIPFIFRKRHISNG